MEKNNEKLTKKKVIVLLVLLVLVIIIGTSYALWQLTLRQSNENTVTTGCFKVEFTDKNSITLGDAYPISDIDARKLVPYQFTITNICSREVEYYINLETLTSTNPLSEEYLRASLTSSNKEEFLDTLKDEYVNLERVISESSKAFMLSSGSLIENESKTFNLRLWLDYDTPLNDDTINKTYQGKITVLANYTPDIVVKNMMIPMDINAIASSNMPMSNNTYTQNDKYKLSKVSFESTITNYEDVVEVVDFSNDQSGSVQGYYVKDQGLETYTLHIQADGKIQANPNSYAYFATSDAVPLFNGIENIDTSHVENMSWMFYKYKPGSIDLSGFNTKNVTDMNHMFASSNITTLDLSSFDTRRVTDMGGMFESCKNLRTVKLDSFDTRNVVNMGAMFNQCSILINIDLSNFDTSKVTTMSFMFMTCNNLTSLDLRSFDTSNVTEMHGMFNGCSSLNTLDLSSFNTSQVASMQAMFSACGSLPSLDLSNFDTSKVTNMQQMFADCSSLKSLNLSSFDTNKVTNMYAMFGSCKNLTTTLTINNLSSTDYRNMFNNSATESGSKIVVNYKNTTSALVDNMITTKSTNSNVVKGELVD